MTFIDTLEAPLFVSWQLTRDCDLACLHCCTDSAPNKHLPDELGAAEAMRIADEIIALDVPYVMLCGGEPLRAPWFLPLAERLGEAGVLLKIETNGQNFTWDIAERLARLPIRSIQISLDADTEASYAKQRPGASLAKVHAACRLVRDLGMPLEVTFAPTILNIHEAEAVLARARALGAFRFNTGRLMRIGRAARLYARIEPSEEQATAFRIFLDRESRRLDDTIEVCQSPFTVEEGLQQSLDTPPATLLVLPNGWVKVAASLGFVCGDLRRSSLREVWKTYRAAWHSPAVRAAALQAIADPTLHAAANNWTSILEGAL